MYESARSRGCAYSLFFFFFNDTATTEIYTLSLHDALPISTFEYVTTNGFGTHIAMAAYCGAKVSVFGPFAPFPPERMAATHAVKIHPELLDAACELCTEAAMRRHYPFLFVDPDQAIARPEWGAAEVGERSRVA